MPRAAFVTVSVACLALLTASCGDEKGGDGPPGGVDGDRTSSVTEGSPTVSTPGSDESPTEDLSVPPGGKPGAMLELRGTVEPGVEPGCHLLTDGGTTYLLVGGEVTDGQRVRVLGHVQPNLMTTCQQGVPFRVTRVDPVD
jgi:hypothetical protein